MNLGLFADDKFSLEELTASINEQQPLPTRLAKLGLFEEEGVSTLAVNVERNADTLSLVPAGTRGTIGGNQTGGGKRSVMPFNTVHLPTSATINADDIQGLRAFGSTTELETLVDYVTRRQAKMRRRIDATVEYQRIGAIKGIVVDADGVSVLADLYKAFQLQQQVHAMALDVGLNAIAAHRFGAPRQTSTGVQVGRHSLPGAFIVRKYGGGVYRRLTKDRFPLELVKIQIREEAGEALRRAAQEAEARMLVLLRQELEYEVHKLMGRAR